MATNETSNDANEAAVSGENTASGTGVHGKADTGEGVFGESISGRGIHGESQTWQGVFGKSTDNAGVVGESTNLHGVFGICHNPHGAGVFGTNDKADGFGVQGENEAGDGVHGKGRRGVVGESQSFRGVFGWSFDNAGVVGESTNLHGVFGICHNPNGGGVFGTNDKPGGFGVIGVSDAGIGISGKGGVLAGHFEGNVEVTGTITAHGDVICTGADCAEDFDITTLEKIEPGTVMSINDEGVLAPSQQAYDKRVAGVISGAGQLRPAIILDKRKSDRCRLPIALVGKVYCKVDAQYGPIQMGDLLTTSSSPGHAMKANDRHKAFGSVIGKALGAMKDGHGLIPILIALQ
jgi:hypothetical protein